MIYYLNWNFLHGRQMTMTRIISQWHLCIPSYYVHKKSNHLLNLFRHVSIHYVSLRTYGPTVVPPHRWRWLKHWSSCNRCNEHKKCGDEPARVGRFLSTQKWTRRHEMIFFWIRGEGGSSLKVNRYVCKWMLFTIKFRPPVATNILYHPVVSC